MLGAAYERDHGSSSPGIAAFLPDHDAHTRLKALAKLWELPRPACAAHYDSPQVAFPVHACEPVPKKAPPGLRRLGLLSLFLLLAQQGSELGMQTWPPLKILSAERVCVRAQGQKKALLGPRRLYLLLPPAPRMQA